MKKFVFFCPQETLAFTGKSTFHRTLPNGEPLLFEKRFTQRGTETASPNILDISDFFSQILNSSIILEVNSPSPPNSRLISTFRAIPKAASAIVILVGCLVLVGWMLDLPILKSILPSWVTMKANTAIAFVFSGMSLWLLHEEGKRRNHPFIPSRHRIGQVLACTVAIIGLLTLSQYLFTWNLGIDQLVFREMSGAVGTSHLGRMAPTTALNFSLLGFALLLLERRTQQGNCPFQFLTLSAALVSLQPLLGYVYKLESLYSIASYAQIALHTVLTFIVLCVGILSARPDWGVMRIVTSDRTSGFIARRLLLSAIAIPSVLGWLIVQGYRLGLYNTAFGLSIIVMVSIVIFAVWILQNAQTLEQLDAKRSSAQQALRESEERYRAFIEQSSEGIWRFELEQPLSPESPEDQQIQHFYQYGYLAECNNVMAKMYGFSEAQEIVGIKLKELLIPSDPHNIEYLRAFIRSGYRLNDAQSHEVDKQGLAKYFLNNLVGIVENGFLVRAWGTQRDITERKRLEEAQQETNQTLQALIEASPLGIMTLDAEANLKMWSPAAHSIFGWTEQEVLGRPIPFVREDQQEEFRRLHEKKLQGKSLSSVEVRRQKKDGSPIDIAVWGAPLPDAQGSISSTMAVIADITERKRNQALLAAQTRVMEMIATGAALPQVLDVLVRSIEEQSDEAICALLLLDKSKTKLSECIAPTLPQSYKDVVKQGVVIGPCMCSCGTAAYRREPVIVSDIANDPLWTEYRDLPLSHGLQACWSMPIFSSNEEVLGTFAMYYQTPRSPSPEEWQLIEISAHLAGIAIERQQGESALKESEERFRKFFEEAPIGISVVDLDGRFLKVNKTFCKMLGYLEEELHQLTFAAITHPEDIEKDLAYAEQLFKGEIPSYQLEKRYIKQNGEILWINLTVTAICETNGKACYGMGMVEDITQRKQDQEALQETNQTLQALIQACPLAITVFSLDDGKVKMWNPAAERIFGWSEPEALGRFLPSVPEDKHDEFLANLDWVRQGNALTGVEARRQKRDSSQVDISVWAAPLCDAKGNVSCMSIVADISDRKRLEEEREQLLIREQAARSAAEEANRMKDEFLATLSHELRTPLNAMLGWTQMLRTRKLNEATTARALETIDRNTKSLGALIEDVLDVSGIIKGKLHLNLAPVELVPVIEAAINTVSPAAMLKEIQIESIVDDSVEPVFGDVNRLQQVVWNLLSNAVKFTPQKGRVEVRLERVDRLAGWQSEEGLKVDRLQVEGSNPSSNLQPPTPCVQISVSDTGKGIAPDFLPYVFDRFRQENSSTTRSYGGLGLGLAIARHLVELHGGTIYAASRGEGNGATFSVQLPLVYVSKPASNPSPVDSTAEGERL